VNRFAMPPMASHMTFAATATIANGRVVRKPDRPARMRQPGSGRRGRAAGGHGRQRGEPKRQGSCRTTLKPSSADGGMNKGVIWSNRASDTGPQ
jgi:hypothetical protein